MIIKRLSIQNYKSIHNLEIECNDRINVIVGINGAGKSTILQTLEILFSWAIARMRNMNGKGSSIALTNINQHADACKLEAELENGVKWSLYRQRPNKRTGTKEKSELTEITNYINSLLKDNIKNNYPLIASYNVNRSVIDIPVHVRKKYQLDIDDLYKDSLVGGANLRSFYEWFREREDIENEKIRYEKEYTNDIQLTSVRKAIQTLLPEYGELRVQRKSPKGFILKKGEETFRIDQLSDGEKCYMTLVGDIARRLAIANPLMPNPLEGNGIILIDEIELHLHPKWQSEIIEQFRSIFPNCQFFITTHSPHVVSNIRTRENENLIILESGKRCFSQLSPFGQEVDSILTNIFSMSTLRNIEVQELIDSIWSLLGNKEYHSDLLNSKIERLKNILGKNDLELARITLEIEKLKKLSKNEKNQ